MLPMRWTLLAVLVVGAVFGVQNRDLEREKRQQELVLSIRFGPNDETILQIDGEDVVFLTGNNAQCIEIQGFQILMFSPGGILLVFPANGVGPFTDIQEYRFLGASNEYEEATLGEMALTRFGPGTLYISDGLVFFTVNDMIISDIAAIKATAPPLRTRIVVTPVINDGRLESQLDVNNGNLTLILTGASALRLGVSSDHRITYSGSTLTVQQGQKSRQFRGIETFGAFRVPAGTSEPQYSVFSSATTEVIQGPGQVYVSEGELTAFFVEDFSFRSDGNDVSESINTQIFDQAFNFQTIGNRVIVRNNANAEIVTLSSNTRKVDLPFAAGVTYSESERNLTFRDRSERINTFNGILQFSIFANNSLQTFPSPPDASLSLTTGGCVYVDILQGAALFASNSNPSVIQNFNEAIPSVAEMNLYEIITNNDNVRLLRLITRNATTLATVQTEIIQTVTGAYVTGVRELQNVNYNNGVVLIRNSDSSVVERIEQVDRLVANTESVPFGSFSNASPVPFSGPGTLSYSRGTAFYTAIPSLGNSIAFASDRAPIPYIAFERFTVGSNIVDGVNYTISGVTQTIGGDRVITYEASSFSTSPDQEILYSGSRVTVHEPIRAGSGSVSFNGGEQTVTYTDTSGNSQTITGIETFRDFSGGDITTTSSLDDRTVQGPGKLYVSQDGTEVLFSTTNIFTSDVANFIREGVIDFSVDADQFSTVYTHVFNLSTDAAIVTYPGGGAICSSTFNGTDYSFYTDDSGVSSQINQAVSTLLTLTKSAPLTDQGILRIIFNGQAIYSFLPVEGNSDIRIGSTGSFVFNGSALTSNSLPDGSYTGINRVTTFDGVKVLEFNSSVAPVEFGGSGLLLVESDSDRAFFTTSQSTISYLLQAITFLKEFIIAPQIEPAEGRVITKLRNDTISFGKNVRAFQGADITFECTIRNARPEPTIEFFRVIDEMSVIPLNNSVLGIDIVNNTLTITSIDRDDSGVYRCRANNDIPPAATADSTLTVRNAVAPRVRPGWFPFDLQNEQRIYWPSEQEETHTFNIQDVEELVFACRVEGKPKPEVVWTFNDLDIESGMSSLNFTITVVSQGRSALTIVVEPNEMQFRMQNVIDCTATNAAGSTRGRVTLQGIVYICNPTGEIGPCSRTCGFGTAEVIYTCLRLGLPELPPETVPESQVPEQVLSQDERFELCITVDPINPIICPLTEYRWNSSEWSDCSRTCGGGSRTRNVTCLNVSIPIDNRYAAQINDVTETVANETMCVMFDDKEEKPADRELCNEQLCTIWQASEYSECSTTCGNGTRVRSTTCYTILGNFIDKYGQRQLNLTEVDDDSECDEEDRPQEIGECNKGMCFYRWAPGAFGPCGDVILPEEFKFCRQRELYCFNADPNPDIVTRRINNRFCAGQTQPTSLGSCNGGRCFNGVWEALSWSQCSETCGYGTHTRAVQCRSPQSLTLVPNDFCDSAKMPTTQQQCFLQNCENTCLRDESSLCTIWVRLMLCDSAFAMGDNGLRCCVSCLGMAEED